MSYILSLGVTREYRRRGIASRLLDHYLTYVNNQPMLSPNNSNSASTSSTGGDCVKAVYLHVLHSNNNAITFYQNRLATFEWI